jgi:Na+-driven multidrug efflux pump
LNISLNWVLMQFMGVAGIALSTSIVYMVLSVFLGFVLSRKLNAISLPRCA